MRILGIHIDGFGKLLNANIKFNEKINIIYGKNEAGKSTTHSFIKSMLFGLNKKRSRANLPTFNKYEPWDNKEIYKGSLVFEYKNKTYTIERVFNSTETTLIVKNNTDDSYINNPSLFLNSVLSNLTETSFDNTISISQLKSATEIGMATELKKYISNLNTSGDLSINTIAAIEYLKQQRKQVEAKQIKDATINYTKMLGSIKNAEREIKDPKYKNTLTIITKKKQKDNDKIKDNEKLIDKIENEIDLSLREFNQNGFDNRTDIDTLKLEADKFINEFYKLKDGIRKATKLISNVFMIIIGFALSVINTIFLVVAYPEIGSIINIYTISSSFEKYTYFLNLIPIPAGVIIILLYIISIILFISGIVLLITNMQSSKKLKEIISVLSTVFSQHIGSNVVNIQNIKLFNSHIDDMYYLIDQVDNKRKKIKYIKEEIEHLREAQDNYLLEIQEQQRLQYEVEQKIDKINQLKNEAEKIKEDIDLNDTLQKDIDSYTLSIDMLNELSSKIKIMFGTYLNENASKYISGITNGKYDSLNVDNSFNVTINTNDRIILIEQLSSGTMDQIYLALRLSIADIINRNNEALPLLFDDCFALYDNDRLEATLNWLNENYNGQIILFTCHTREKDILNKLRIKHNFVEI